MSVLKTSKEIKPELNECDMLQKKMFDAVKDAQDELDSGNNKYAVNVLHETTYDVYGVMEGTTNNAERYIEDVLVWINQVAARELTGTDRPSQERVQDLIDATRYAVNCYDEYDLRLIRWEDYMD